MEKEYYSESESECEPCCVLCDDTTEGNSYLDSPLCYCCYRNQISHSIHDKAWDDCSEEEQDEVEDYICDNMTT